MSNVSIQINFLNNTNDTILLAPVSNIPGEPTPCLYSGKLQLDQTSVVAVSGCRDSNETTLSIASSLVPGGLVDLVLVNGSTLLVNGSNLIIGDETLLTTSRVKRQIFKDAVNDYIFPPPETIPVRAVITGPLPRAAVLETSIKYDNSLLNQFGGKHRDTKNWISRVVELAKPRLSHSSLDITISLKVVGELEYVDDNLAADEPTLKRLAHSEKYRSLTSFFCANFGNRYVGIAYVGTACVNSGHSININEYYTHDNSELHSARVFVHELGHNVGMLHDFEDDHGGYDSSCNGKGLMSYGDVPDKWSKCSNSDFTSWYRTEGHACMEPKEGSGGNSGCCAVLHLTGTYFDGKYELMSTKYNNRAVYKETSGDGLCFFFDNNWKLGSCFLTEWKYYSTVQGFFWSEGDFECPEDVGDNWSGRGPVSRDISVSCS